VARFVCDLATVAPLTPIAEARSKDEIASIAQKLRRKKGWVKEGRTILEIRKAIDPYFIQHAVHYDRMVNGDEGYPAAKGIRKVWLEAGEGVAAVVIDGSREWDKSKHDWQTRIRFNNYDVVRRHPMLTWTERARLLLRDNVQVHCTCPAYHYYHQYAATEKGFALIPEGIPADINNPRDRGGVCKHLDHALRYLGGSYTTIAAAMKKHFAVEETTMDPTSLWEKGTMFAADGFHGSDKATFTISKAGAVTHLHKDGEHVASFDHENWSKVATIGRKASAGHLGFYDRVTDTDGNVHKVGAFGTHGNHIHFSHRKGGVVTDYHIGIPKPVKENVSESTLPTPPPQQTTATSLLSHLAIMREQASKAGMAKTAQMLGLAISAGKLEGAHYVDDKTVPSFTEAAATVLEAHIIGAAADHSKMAQAHDVIADYHDEMAKHQSPDANRGAAKMHRKKAEHYRALVGK